MPQVITGVYKNGVVKPSERVDISADEVKVIIVFPDRTRERRMLKKFPVGDLGEVNEKMLTRETIYHDYLSDRL